MDRTEFRETFPQGHPFKEAHVTGDVIHNVALLGATSLNDRTYTTKAMQDAAELYSGAPVYVNHPTDSEMRERGGVRSVLDLAGRVLNARLVGTQVRGDIQVLEREPTQSLFLGIAQQMPEVAGMSHRARGTVEVDEHGHETVTSLDRVFAVELVAEPATVAGLFESITDEATKRRHEPLDLRSLGEGHISFGDITKRVRTALTELEKPGEAWLHIEALFDDRVVYQIDSGPLFQRSWVMDAEGNVTLGDGRIEVQKLTTFEPVTSEPQENEQMKIEDLTLDQLKDQRPDLLKSITEGTEAQRLAKDNKRLAEENDSLKAADAERDRQAMVDAKLAEAKLPKTVVTEHFTEQLKAAKDEAAVDALIEDRKKLVESVSTGNPPRQPERDIDSVIADGNRNGDRKFKEVTADTITEARKSLFV